MKLFYLLVIGTLSAAVIAALFYTGYRATCMGIIVPGARIAGSTEIALDLPIIPDCTLARFYGNRYLNFLIPKIKIENVEIASGNMQLRSWEQSKDSRSISLTFNAIDEQETGGVDSVDFTLPDGRIVHTDVKVAYIPLQYTTSVSGTDYVEILPMTVRPGQLEPTGITLIRHTLGNAKPLATLGAGISYPGSTLLNAYWIPLAEFNRNRPEVMPETAIDITRPATIPGETGVFYFDFSPTNVVSPLFVKACVEVYVKTKEPIYFGVGQCEEGTADKNEN
jgi:hypothetical protein